MPKYRYYMKYTVVERPHMHRYDFEKYVDIRPRAARKRALRAWEREYEAKLKDNGIDGQCTVTIMARTIHQPKRIKGIPEWIKNLAAGTLFMAILIALLYIASAPWM